MWEAEALNPEVDAGVKRSERVNLNECVVSKYERRALREMGEQAPKETRLGLVTTIKHDFVREEQRLRQAKKESMTDRKEGALGLAKSNA